MYIIKEKTGKTVIDIGYIDRTPDIQPNDLYPGFEPETMEIGWCGPQGIPEHYKIDADNQIIELSIEEKIEGGIVTLSPFQKIQDNTIVDKTLEDQVKDGLITISPEQEIIDNQIVPKSLEKKVQEGLITLSSNQKLIGKDKDAQIVPKTLTEMVEDGTIKLLPTQKIENDLIITKNDHELIDEGIINLDDYKQRKIQLISELSFKIRSDFLPDYKLQNAALGIYDEAKTAVIKATVQAFKDEYNRLEGLVMQAPDANAVDAITPNFPDKLIEITA